MTDIHELLTKFSYNQNVRITKGFNRGQKGVVKSVELIKEDKVYTIEIEDKETSKITKLKVKENFLMKGGFF